MKRMWNTLLGSALLAAMLCLLTACGPKFDASGYVKAGLDADLHGDSAAYEEILEITPEEAQEEYNEVLDTMIEQFDGVLQSDDMKAEYRSFFADLLKKTDYTVLEATENEDGSFTVPVEAKPITSVFSGLAEELDAKMNDYANELIASGEILDEDEITQHTFELLLGILQSRVDSVEYGEPQTVNFTIAKDADGAYCMNDQDMLALMNAMIDLGDLAG